MEIIWRVISCEGKAENGGKDAGERSIIGRYKIDRGRLRIGNGVTKELICMTHTHELGGRDCWREWGVPGRGRQRGKNWNNYNSIINKMYF